MKLEPVVIDGKRGTAAYFDREFRMVDKGSKDATMAKVVFEDGSRAFYVVAAKEPA